MNQALYAHMNNKRKMKKKNKKRGKNFNVGKIIIESSAVCMNVFPSMYKVSVFVKL
jgi:hypothetical protein